MSDTNLPKLTNGQKSAVVLYDGLISFLALANMTADRAMLLSLLQDALNHADSPTATASFLQAAIKFVESGE